MHVLFIRHGEPNYENVHLHSLVSYLGELTHEGELQAEKVARNFDVQSAEIIVSSPFTRALQTAAIIARHSGAQFFVEQGLHEWLADKSHQRTLDSTYVNAAYREFVNHNGIHDESCLYNWESAEEIAARTYPVLRKYLELGYSNIIVVAHAMVIRSFGYKEQDMHFCGTYSLEFTKDTKYDGFVPWNG